MAYELAAGVAVPLASRIGVGPAAALFGGATAAAYRQAGRRDGADAVFCAVDGLALAAVLGHFSSWPRTRRYGLPWLEECEGLRGRVLQPYNLLLHASGLLAAAGLFEHRRGRGWGLLAGAIALPLLRQQAPREYDRLLDQAARHPRWWNRRLQPDPGAVAEVRTGPGR